jgi:hypothetical protein
MLSPQMMVGPARPVVDNCANLAFGASETAGLTGAFARSTYNHFIVTCTAHVAM